MISSKAQSQAVLLVVLVACNGAYRIVGGEEGGRGREVCLDDLSAGRH